jgi:hypothetical protein
LLIHVFSELHFVAASRELYRLTIAGASGSLELQSMGRLFLMEHRVSGIFLAVAYRSARIFMVGAPLF